MVYWSKKTPQSSIVDMNTTIPVFLRRTNCNLSYLIMMLFFPSFVFPSLIFHSGFELKTTPVYDSRTATRLTDLLGVDNSVEPPNDWKDDLEAQDRHFWFNYADYSNGGANPKMLGACLTEDPDNTGNAVLYLWQSGSELQDGGFYSRVQGELENLNLQEVYYKVRFRIGSDIAAVNEYSYEDCKLSFVSFRTGESGKQVMISIMLHKWGNKQSFSDGTSPLKWRAEVKDYTNGSHYLYDNSGVEPVYDEWQTLEFYIKSGDARTGRYWVRLNEKDILFDEIVQTRNGLAGKDLESARILKAYAVHPARKLGESGKKVEVWYDDLEIWDTFPFPSTQSISGKSYRVSGDAPSAGATSTSSAILIDAISRVGDAQLRVADLRGRIVYIDDLRWLTESGQYRLSTYGWSPGIYTLSISTHKGLRTQKIIVGGVQD